MQEGLAEGLAAGLAKGEAEGLAKGEAKGEAKGLAKAANQIAVNMLNSNISLDLIAQFTGLSLKQVEKLQNLSKKQSAMPKSSKTMRSLKP